MLAHRLRRWYSIKPTLFECVMHEAPWGLINITRSLHGPVFNSLTLSSLNLPLSSSSTTSRELLSQFSTCSGWRWLVVGDKWKMKNNTPIIKRVLRILSLCVGNWVRYAKWCFAASWGSEGWNQNWSYLNPYSAGIDFRRHNLTTHSDVWSRFPHCKSTNIYNGRRHIT